VDEEAKKPLGLEALILEEAHVYAVRPNGEIIFWNSGSEQLYGWSKKEALGKIAHELLKTEFPAKIAEFTRLLLESDEWSGELIQYCLDGRKITVSSHVIVHRDGQGSPDAIVVVNNDATKLRKTEEALLQGRLDMERAQEVGQVGSWRMDVASNVLKWSKENHRIFGIPEGTSLTYETFLSVVHPGDREFVDKSWKASLAGGPYDIEHRVIADGRVKWVREKAYMEFDDGGKLLGGFGITQDITGRKMYETELAGQKQELQVILDTVPAMIFYKDSENRFLKVNRSFCEFMGMPREKLEGKTLFELYPEKQARHFWKDDLEVIKTGKPKTGIIEPILTKKGEIMVQTDKMPYYDVSGRIIGITGFSMDMTARINAEENLKKYNRMLRAISSSNQVLMHAKNEQEYLKESCKIVVKECGYKLAWIGFAEKDARKTVRPVAQAGYEEGYLKKLDITWADTERGRGPTGVSIRTGKISMSRNMMTDPAFRPWRIEAKKRGYASSIALPLKSVGRIFGSFMLYSAEPDPFSKDEIKLLEELAFDLSYGIILIREREKNTNSEAMIKKIATRTRSAK
jgi:PAS domain S-box-containing protein